MAIKQLTVFVENKPGSMSAMTAVLAENNINMRALSLAETSDFGIVRIIVDDIYKATTVLKDAGYIHSVTDVIAVGLPNIPGGLNKVLNILEGAGLNIEYMYGLSIEGAQAYVVLKSSDAVKLDNLLTDNNIETLDCAFLATLQ